MCTMMETRGRKTRLISRSGCAATCERARALLSSLLLLTSPAHTRAHARARARAHTHTHTQHTHNTHNTHTQHTRAHTHTHTTNTQHTHNTHTTRTRAHTHTRQSGRLGSGAAGAFGQPVHGEYTVCLHVCLSVWLPPCLLLCGRLRRAHRRRHAGVVGLIALEGLLGV